MMNRIGSSGGVMLALAMTMSAGASGSEQRQAGRSAQPAVAVAVYKTPTCGCCSTWVEHLRARGFAPAAIDMDDLSALKAKFKVPSDVQTCHTAIVDGYVIEGHVPASAIQRLLKERPAVLGLAVPGMPTGSPGMEGPGAQPYDVFTFDKQGKLKVFSTERP
jgi:hypothetical protein